jgi:hypothetical protein
MGNLAMMANEPSRPSDVNAVFRHDCLMIMTPVSKGDEIFVFYSAEYTRTEYRIDVSATEQMLESKLGQGTEPKPFFNRAALGALIGVLDYLYNAPGVGLQGRLPFYAVRGGAQTGIYTCWSCVQMSTYKHTSSELASAPLELDSEGQVAKTRRGKSRRRKQPFSRGEAFDDLWPTVRALLFVSRKTHYNLAIRVSEFLHPEAMTNRTTGCRSRVSELGFGLPMCPHCVFGVNQPMEQLYPRQTITFHRTAAEIVNRRRAERLAQQKLVLEARLQDDGIRARARQATKRAASKADKAIQAMWQQRWNAIKPSIEEQKELRQAVEEVQQTAPAVEVEDTENERAPAFAPAAFPLAEAAVLAVHPAEEDRLPADEPAADEVTYCLGCMEGFSSSPSKSGPGFCSEECTLADAAAALVADDAGERLQQPEEPAVSVLGGTLDREEKGGQQQEKVLSFIAKSRTIRRQPRQQTVSTTSAVTGKKRRSSNSRRGTKGKGKKKKKKRKTTKANEKPRPRALRRQANRDRIAAWLVDPDSTPWTFMDHGTVHQLFALLNAAKPASSRCFFMAPELGSLITAKLSDVEHDNIAELVKEVCLSASSPDTTDLFMPAMNERHKNFRIYFPVYEEGSWSMWVLEGPREHPAAKIQQFIYCTSHETASNPNITKNLESIAERLLASEPSVTCVVHTSKRIFRADNQRQDTGAFMCIHGTQLIKPKQDQAELNEYVLEESKIVMTKWVLLDDPQILDGVNVLLLPVGIGLE